MRKTLTFAILHLLTFTFLFTIPAAAQSLTSDDIKSQMIKDWERAKAYTIDYLNTMPADKYSFKATDSVRSFAQQMLHLAGGNIFIMSTATDQQPPAFPPNLEASPSAQTKDSVMYYVTASYDYCIDAVKKTPVSKWGEMKKVFGRYEETRFSMMNKTFEHQGHHRGQTTIYIRLVGIKPPQERLF